MAQHVGRQMFHVLGSGEIAVLQERAGACRPVEVEAGPGRGPVFHESGDIHPESRGIAGRPDQREDVVANPVVHIDRLDGVPGGGDLLRAHHRFHLRNGEVRHPLQDDPSLPQAAGNPILSFIMKRSTCASGSG